MPTLIILAFVCITTVAAQHTAFFTAYWTTIGNTNAYFYDNRTFGQNYPVDPCTPINRTVQFRQYVAAHTPCQGAWCLNITANSRGWGCRRGNSRACYNVEHIIDLNGPELTDYDKNIHGIDVLEHR